VKELHEDILVSELKKGSESAFKNLVDTYQKKVFNTSLSFVHNIEDAEDVSQEVFIEIFKAMTGFREDSSLNTWIYRITVNKSLEFIRKRKVKKRFALLSSLFGDEQQKFQVPDFNHPGLVMEDQEMGKILYEAIGKLPKNQNVAFVLHNIEGLSYQEVAGVLQTTLSSVESLIFRAKSNLRKYLISYYKKL
jgi:RNA polymerase sigma factor (sigma-70 family)